MSDHCPACAAGTCELEEHVNHVLEQDNGFSRRTVDPTEYVHHPQHYGGDTVYEAIKVIEAWGLGFHLGNTVKYIRRIGFKGDPLEDARKARWYLDRWIEREEARRGG